MARILLINPPFYRLLGSHYNANSLGIAYMAAFLNQNGHDAWLYNADFMDRKEYENLKSLFEGFHDYKVYFNDENHEIWEEVVQKIVDFAPDWVGWTCYTANVSAIDILSKKVKKRLKNVKQVVGGPHPTLDRDLLKKLPAIDYACAREGEEVMLNLVNGGDPKKILGCISRNALGFIMHNGDAPTLDTDALPFPERDKFWGLTEDQKKTVDVSYVVSIRGCPYRCNYCASPYYWKRDKTQYRSPDSLIKELHFLKNNYWNREKEFDYAASANAAPKNKLLIKDNAIVYFVDDVFTVKRDRVKEILKRMIDEKLDMPWKCEARTDHLDEEICDLMAKAGCERVKLGFESGSDRILKEIEKDETKDDMRRGANMLKNAGVPFTAYFMTGFPGETDDDLRQTIEFAKEIDADFYSLSVLAPYFGTKLYYNLIEKGYPLDKAPWEYFFHQTGEMLVNDLISKEVLDEYLALNELNKGKGYV